MSIVRFPRKKLTASAELRNSTLAKPARRLEVVIEGDLAEVVTVAAGNAQITPDALVARSLHAIFDGGQA